jgi:hypothetical protein
MFRKPTRLVVLLTPESPGFVPLVTALELAWVLSSAYELGRAQLIEALEGLLRSKELVVERGETVWKSLRLLQRSERSCAPKPRGDFGGTGRSSYEAYMDVKRPLRFKSPRSGTAEGG